MNHAFFMKEKAFAGGRDKICPALDESFFISYNFVWQSVNSEGVVGMFTSRLENERTDILAEAFLSLESREDCYRLFEDLFTIREIQDLTQRLEVAQLLQKKTTYTEIVERTGVSTATIGRVNRALNYGAGGYQRVLEKLNQKDTDK